MENVSSEIPPIPPDIIWTHQASHHCHFALAWMNTMLWHGISCTRTERRFYSWVCSMACSRGSAMKTMATACCSSSCSWSSFSATANCLKIQTACCSSSCCSWCSSAVVVSVVKRNADRVHLAVPEKPAVAGFSTIIWRFPHQFARSSSTAPIRLTARLTAHSTPISGMPVPSTGNRMKSSIPRNRNRFFRYFAP